jgi:hypothetical protein
MWPIPELPVEVTLSCANVQFGVPGVVVTDTLVVVSDTLVVVPPPVAIVVDAGEVDEDDEEGVDLLHAASATPTTTKPRNPNRLLCMQ